MQKKLKSALDKLGQQFSSLDLSFHKMKEGKAGDLTSYFPAPDNEDIVVCVFKGKEINEPFHRQDFFFINYAYKNNYQALSKKSNNLITIKENEFYIGQPYSGYALKTKNKEEVIIIGILIRRNSFFREFLPAICMDYNLFQFFIAPKNEKFSAEYIRLSFNKNDSLRTILELMIIEAANKNEDSQRIIKSLLQTLFLEVARKFRLKSLNNNKSLTEQILDYIADYADITSLKQIARHFDYHPNYISSLLHKNTGRKFSELLLEKRMERSLLLIKNTNLSIEEISAILGYSNQSNFYKAFKNYYGISPRKALNA